MSADDDYMALLKRAKIACPEVTENHERFEIPELDILQEGKITVFRNFIDVTDKLRRDPQHLLQFLLKELGTPGNVEGRRAVFKAKINPQQIDDKIQMYTETYVICSECGLPDTKMTKDGRTLMLECEACGARRPIMVRKSARVDSANTLREGDIVELSITDVGKKGDGIGKFYDYLVVVPGTVKGSKIHAKITKISAKTAFAVPTTEAATRR
ncbi:MAG: translation initiation factor IF-2 subunit beta [Candidatus Methanomethylophilaceae archaeon]|nr:translation initiation factor IF-2 subunit beta [Thermoplasmata archaeon]MBQ3684933.1 translation initiation factor IF-2 subunit beta [Candidatus Methanomethylophilaceae archaeon]